MLQINTFLKYKRIPCKNIVGENRDIRFRDAGCKVGEFS
jgi:hypothetical protein